MVTTRGNVEDDIFAFTVPDWRYNGDIREMSASSKRMVCQNMVSRLQVVAILLVLVPNGILHT
jgi:hypothetical protein